MPKVKPLGVTQREKDRADDERLNKLLIGQIYACKKMLGLNTEELCARIGISQPTMRRREQSPDDFTVRELRALNRLMKRECTELPMPFVEVLG